MALTKITRSLLNTGVSDSSDATAITIDSSENVTLAANLEVSGADVTITSNIIHAGDTNTFFGFNDADTFRIVTGGSEALRVASNQRVGIGETSPSAPLTVNTGSDGNNVYIDNNGTQLAIGSNSSVNYINSQNGGAILAIQNNGIEKLSNPLRVFYTMVLSAACKYSQIYSYQISLRSVRLILSFVRTVKGT